MKNIVRYILVIAAMCCFTACSSLDTCSPKSSANGLKIGWAKRSIAKEGPAPITGQGFLRISQGTYTPVYASALAISNKEDAVIFVSMDMVSYSPIAFNKVLEFLKKEAPEIPAEKVIVNSSHTHAGPSANIVPTDYPRQVKVTSSPEMQEWLARQVTDAIKEAWANRKPGSIAYGYGFATTGHSRRVVYTEDKGKLENVLPGNATNGLGKMYGDTNDKTFDCYEAGTDAFINLMYTFDQKGKLTGAVINTPCPAQTNEGAWEYHASFWHHVRENLRKKYGEIGVIGQAGASGDLSPRQLHYHKAEFRRYRLKYAKEIEAYYKNPIKNPLSVKWTPEQHKVSLEGNSIEFMRSIDIASRITAAFDEVLSWAQNDKQTDPVLKHEVRTVKLSRQIYPKSQVEQEQKNYKTALNQKYQLGGDPWRQLMYNSRIRSRRGRITGVLNRYELQKKEPGLTTNIHAVRIGNIAFATNRFELFLDYQHRIQARSPFEQTFVVQLVTDPYGVGSYLATEKAVKHRGYSAVPYSNQVSPKGGQELVEETLKVLNQLKPAK